MQSDDSNASSIHMPSTQLIHSALPSLASSSNPGSPVMSNVQVATPSPITTKRRSSSRSIKRRKFDDELVESSLFKSNTRTTHHHKGIGIGGPPGSLPTALASPVPSASSTPPTPSSVTAPNTPTIPVSQTISGGPGVSGWDYHSMTEYATSSITSEKKKSSKPSTKRVKRQKNQSALTKNLGRWKPSDDLLLIRTIQQTNDIQSVHRGVKLSCKFTLQEIQERWYALLYDPVISKMAVNGMKQLHPEVINSIKSKCLFSKQEEKLLHKIPSNSQPSLDKFQELLDTYPEIFYPSRTAKSLLMHWTLMKQYHLLPDQSVQPLPRGDHVLNFSDAEDLINDSELQDQRDEQVEHELNLADRRVKREVRQLESEIPRWKVLVDSITGISPPDLDNHTLAVLRGRLVRYLMRSREITLGRQTNDNSVDVDLSLEGPAWKISRKQGIIKLWNTGDFYIANEGRRPIYVDGKPVLTGNKFKLNHNSIVEISCLRFVFLTNQELITVIRNETSKSVATTSS